MKKNIVKEKIRKEIPSIGTWVSSANPLVCEVLCNTGIDWINIESEHSSADLSDIVHCFRAIEHSGVIPFVRVAGNNPLIIKRVLDIGALGVVIPDIKDAEDASKAVAACRYPPLGKRGIGATRPNAIYSDYMDNANNEICVVLMIEDIQAVNKIESIMKVPGIDVIFIGPNDLAATLEVPLGMDNQDPNHKDAVKKILLAGKKYNVPVGIHCGGGEEISRRIADGMLWMPIASDVAVMKIAFQNEILKIKKSFEKKNTSSDGKFY